MKISFFTYHFFLKCLATLFILIVSTIMCGFVSIVTAAVFGGIVVIVNNIFDIYETNPFGDWLLWILLGTIFVILMTKKLGEIPDLWKMEKFVLTDWGHYFNKYVIGDPTLQETDDKAIYTDNKSNQKEEIIQNSTILDCPTCNGKLRVPIPIPNTITTCKKCGTRFSIIKDAGGLYRTATITDTADSLYESAEKYHYGIEVQEDIDIAVSFYRKAAKLNHSSSQVILSYLLLGNDDAPTLHQEAFHWANEAANNRELSGYYNLGIMYKEGLGTNTDYTKSLEYFKKYIRFQDNTEDLGDAQFQIALLFKEGLGVEINYDTALTWLKHAQDNGCDHADSEIVEVTNLLREKERMQYKERYEKQHGAVRSKLLNCPSCDSVIRIPIPIPKARNARCKKCGVKFSIKEDQHGNLHISIVGDNAANKEETLDDSVTSTEIAFNVLGIRAGATPAEIKIAYKRLIKKYHPDKVHGLGDEFKAIADRKCKQANAAYDFLCKNSS